MKPWVKKFGAHWAWRCPLNHATAGPVGEEYSTDYRDAWTLATFLAHRHAHAFHGNLTTEHDGPSLVTREAA